MEMEVLPRARISTPTLAELAHGGGFTSGTEPHQENSNFIKQHPSHD